MDGIQRAYDRATRRNVTWFVLVLASAAAVRLIGLFHHATTPDEAFTFFISAHSWAALITLLKTSDFHPPLIYAIGHALFHFSSHAYAFRVITVAFGLGGVAASYALARRIMPRYALAIALLTAISPALVFYDRFFRMYALLWAQCAISWAVLLWALDSPQRFWRWAAYALAACALLYTQYIAVFTIAAQVAFVAVTHRKVWAFWGAIGAALAGFALWVPVFLVQYPLGGTAYNALHGKLSEFTLFPAILMVDGLPPSIEYSPAVSALLWLLLIWGACVAVRERRALALWLVSPLLLQIAYSIVSGKLLVGQRYLLQAIPALILLTFLSLDWIRRTPARAAALPLGVLLSVAMLAGTVDKLFLPQYMQIDWTQYRSFMDGKLQPGDAVVYDGSMSYFVMIGSKAATQRPVFLIANQQDAATMSKRAAEYQRVWYIDYQSSLPDPKHVAFETLLHSHPRRTSWRTTEAGYGDAVLTTLFERPAGKLGPYKTTRTMSSRKTRG